MDGRNKDTKIEMYRHTMYLFSMAKEASKNNLLIKNSTIHMLELSDNVVNEINASTSFLNIMHPDDISTIHHSYTCCCKASL